MYIKSLNNLMGKLWNQVTTQVYRTQLRTFLTVICFANEIPFSLAQFGFDYTAL